MLELTLKTNWYRMIESGTYPGSYDTGEKLEEYRDITDFWATRILKPGVIRHDGVYLREELKHDTVRFSLGYSKNREQMVFEIEYVYIGPAKPEWSDNAPGLFYKIKLGKRIS